MRSLHAISPHDACLISLVVYILSFFPISIATCRAPWLSGRVAGPEREVLASVFFCIPNLIY